MKNECKIDSKQINQIFPDLDRLIEFHQNLLTQLVDRYKTSSHKYINSIGDILLSIVRSRYSILILKFLFL
jgi:hypothetical protein